MGANYQISMGPKCQINLEAHCQINMGPKCKKMRFNDEHQNLT